MSPMIFPKSSDELRNMTKYQALAITTRYWRPGTNYLSEIIDAVRKHAKNGDIVIVSEKAISIAQNNLVNEDSFTPGMTAKFLAKVWMPLIWGYFLGIMSRFGKHLLGRIRTYPKEAGSRHKQVTLQYAGFMPSLLFGSEGGIDGSNLPFSLVSLPLVNAQNVANKIRSGVEHRLGKRITVLIVDTDKTYSFKNFHYTPRPISVSGIHSFGGIFGYIFGKMAKLRKRPTPISISGEMLSVDEALTIANVSDRARGPGSGATVWDMAARFEVTTSGVSWEMLDRIRHKPIVIVRRASSSGSQERIS
jgi:F420-0:gamma-glutamyl ligase-like protein